MAVCNFLNCQPSWLASGIGPSGLESTETDDAAKSLPPAATDIYVNRRAPLGAQDVVAALGALLKTMEPDQAKTVSVLLANFAQSPSDEWITGVLTKALEPSAFAQEKQKYG